MQTFLPYPIFTESAKCLDNKRLGKQRVECVQLLKALAQGPVCLYDTKINKYVYKPYPKINKLPNGYISKKTPGYYHPAAQMWVGSEFFLCLYGTIICNEWIARGFKDTCLDKIKAYERNTFNLANRIPIWINDDRLYDSHKSNLLRKDFEYYKQFKWNVPDNLPYYWPK